MTKRGGQSLMRNARSKVSVATASSSARFAGATVLLAGSSVPFAWVAQRRYGSAAGRRLAAGMTATVLAQQVLVGGALQRSKTAGHPHRLSLVDVMTLTRGGTAALLVGLLASGIRDRRGLGGWLGWTALVYGAIVSDWLDGPIARRFGASEVGAIFDLEADSWLTLTTSAAAVAWGDVPIYAALAPAARYPWLFGVLHKLPYAQAISGDPRWVRHVGMAQMALFIAALAPFGGPATRLAVRIAAPLVATVQLSTLIVLYRRKVLGPGR